MEERWFVLEKKGVKSVPVWVRIPNLSFEFWNPDKLTKIGSPSFADSATSLMEKLAYARVCIEVSTEKELPTFVPLLDEANQEFQQKVIYEWVPLRDGLNNLKKDLMEEGHDAGFVKVQNRKWHKQWRQKSGPNDGSDVTREIVDHVAGALKEGGTPEKKAMIGEVEKGSALSIPQQGEKGTVEVEPSGRMRAKTNGAAKNTERSINHALNVVWVIFGFQLCMETMIARRGASLVDGSRLVGDGAWMIGGDFNPVRSVSEAKGENLPNQQVMDDFNDSVKQLELMEHPYQGNNFTWCRNWKKNGKLRRLDKILCNEKWLEVLQTKLKRVKEKLEVLNKESYSNISCKVVEASRELETVQAKVYGGDLDPNLLLQMKMLEGNCMRLFEAEKFFYRDKSRVTWIDEGDANTPFFHSRLKVQNVKNTIIIIRDASGNMLIDSEDVKGETAADYE
ncbi:hypothetical protein LIER_37059 [Lithospermum erythrorhizon]|uniref:DUF4283 domain-containing protein n=1 Tax=Lithospermum erythrorhizon TaxID=34254 RepID=A0AAV3PG51_LITER